MTGLLQLLDEPCRFEAVETRHLNVEEDDGEFLFQQALQSLLARLRTDQRLVERLEQRFERQQVLGPVVDQ